MSEYSANAAVKQTFYHSTTGLVNGDFTAALFKNGVSSSITVTVTEIGSGYYFSSYTPDSAGAWYLELYQSSVPGILYTSEVRVDTGFVPNAAVKQAFNHDTTGLADGDFTKLLYKNGVANAATVTVSEITSGYYVASYTADSEGSWYLLLYQTAAPARQWAGEVFVTEDSGGGTAGGALVEISLGATDLNIIIGPTDLEVSAINPALNIEIVDTQLQTNITDVSEDVTL